MQEIREGRQVQAMFDLDGFQVQTHTHTRCMLPGVNPGHGFESSWEMSGEEIGHHGARVCVFMCVRKRIAVKTSLIV